MRIQENIKSTNFKSGLSNKIIFREKTINPNLQTLIFAKNYGIETNFLDNKSIALANKLCLDIFDRLAKKLNLSLAPPPAVFTYQKENLINKNSANNFCIPDTMEVLKNDNPFLARSIFFNNFESLDYINYATEYSHKNNITSSSHFLAPFIHEWLHSFQLDYIFKKFGYGGNCEFLTKIYPSKDTKITGVELLKVLGEKTLSDKENEIIYKHLGQYATEPKNQYLEVFSEAFTKLICDSLDGVNLVKSPIENFKNLNKDFQDIIFKICQFK